MKCAIGRWGPFSECLSAATHTVEHTDPSCPWDEGDPYCEGHAKDLVEYLSTGAGCQLSVTPWHKAGVAGFYEEFCKHEWEIKPNRTALDPLSRVVVCKRCRETQVGHEPFPVFSSG